jgi:hypothetical protein
LAAGGVSPGNAPLLGIKLGVAELSVAGGNGAGMDEFAVDFPREAGEIIAGAGMMTGLVMYSRQNSAATVVLAKRSHG